MALALRAFLSPQLNLILQSQADSPSRDDSLIATGMLPLLRIEPTGAFLHTNRVSDVPDDLVHKLVPLRLAAELIFSKVYEGQHIDSREEVLDSIASTIATVAPIYEYGANPTQPARRLSRFELEGG